MLLVNLPSSDCVTCVLCREKIKTVLEEVIGTRGYANGILTVECVDKMKIRGAINGKCVESN